MSQLMPPIELTEGEEPTVESGTIKQDMPYIGDQVGALTHASVAEVHLPRFDTDIGAPRDAKIRYDGVALIRATISNVSDKPTRAHARIFRQGGRAAYYDTDRKKVIASAGGYSTSYSWPRDQIGRPRLLQPGEIVTETFSSRITPATGGSTIKHPNPVPTIHGDESTFPVVIHSRIGLATTSDDVVASIISAVFLASSSVVFSYEPAPGVAPPVFDFDELLARLSGGSA